MGKGYQLKDAKGEFSSERLHAMQQDGARKPDTTKRLLSVTEILKARAEYAEVELNTIPEYLPTFKAKAGGHVYPDQLKTNVIERGLSR